MTLKNALVSAAGNAAADNLYVEDVFSTYLYTGNSSSQTIQNGIALADGATSPGWIATLGGTGTEFGYGITVDSSGNIYVAGYTGSTGAGSDDAFIAKYDSSGTIQWQRTLGGTGNDEGLGITVDSSGNIYVAGRTSSSGAGSIDFLIAKYNSSGTIQWQRTLGGTGSDNGRGIAVDSSGNIYVVGNQSSTGAGSNDALIAKYNSSGTIQWQRTLGGYTHDYGQGITVDSSGNIYVVGITLSSGAGNYDFLIAKYNSSGTIQWQRTLGGTANDQGYGITVDSSGNVYVIGITDSTGAGNFDFLIAKYNSSGTIQWQRTLGGSGVDQGFGITVDSFGNVYVTGLTGSSGVGGGDFLIAKYNSSGTIQWQRTLGGSGSEQGNGIAVDSSGNIYVAGYTSSSGAGSIDVLIAKLPSDGSGAGAYGPFTYAASSLTDAASSLTSATSSLTGAASYLTDAASSLTDASASLTSSLTEVPAVVGEGGLVWIKSRSYAINNALQDTDRGANNILFSNDSAGNQAYSTSITSFNPNGFTLGNESVTNLNSKTFASWTFRKAPKFFDVVTWTGDGIAGRTVAHNLGSVPGMIIVKRLDSTSGWQVYHRSLGSTYYLNLNTTAAAVTPSNRWNDTEPTATVFTVGASGGTNNSGGTFVAYLFAHDAGGFGDDGTENVISCGSYTGNGSGSGPTVTLGWEPQWLLIKRTDSTSNWTLIDNMRGIPTGYDAARLFPNLTDAEITNQETANLLATGFKIGTADAPVNASGGSYIYIAIRRGPMKTPTSGTEVFSPILQTGNGTGASITTAGFAPDSAWVAGRNGSNNKITSDKLIGINKFLQTVSTAAEVTLSSAGNLGILSWDMQGITYNGYSLYSGNTNLFAYYLWKRAPGFFDVVCYTGTGSATTVNHNLGVAPEMVIVKRRNTAYNWSVYNQDIGNTDYLMINTNGQAYTNSIFWNNTSPTDSVFTVGTYAGVNASGGTYVAYLFATVPGVSKVGSYTGTGTTNQIDCGFSGGARFVLIKRTDSTGDWYVYDSARGIVAGNDPYLLLNSTAAEVTTTDYIDPYSAGFELTSTAPADLNASGGTYIFLAIA